MTAHHTHFVHLLCKIITQSHNLGLLEHPLHINEVEQARWRIVRKNRDQYVYLAFIAGRHVAAYGKRYVETSRHSLALANITSFADKNIAGEPSGYDRARDIQKFLDEGSWCQALEDFDSCRPNNITDKHIDSLQKPCNWEWVRYDRHRNMVLQVTAHVNGVKTYNITVILARDLTPCRRYRVIRLCFSPSWWQKLRDFFST